MVQFAGVRPDGISDYGNPYFFTGRRLDILDTASLKIMYYRNRYYDPETGRLLTPDPLGITPNPQFPNVFNIIRQSSDGINLYQYVIINPTNFYDPYGLKWNIFSFFNHYFSNNGSIPVRLEDENVDLLGDFQSSSNVSQQISDWEQDVRDDIIRAMSILYRGARERPVFGNDTDDYNFGTRDSGTLFVLGNGTLRMHYMGFVWRRESVFGYAVTIYYEVRDEFTDPWDLYDWFDGDFNPLGFPYPIHADWSTRISGEVNCAWIQQLLRAYPNNPEQRNVIMAQTK